MLEGRGIKFRGQNGASCIVIIYEVASRLCPYVRVGALYETMTCRIIGCTWYEYDSFRFEVLTELLREHGHVDVGVYP